MKKVLITGAEGFVASYLFRELRNFYQVEGTLFLDKKLEYPSYKLDLTEREKVFSFFKEKSYDYIFHLAGQSSTKVSLIDPYLTYKVNIISTLNILESLRILNKTNTKFIFISTSDVYGKSQYLPVDEKHQLKPLNPYSNSKKICEEIIENYGDFNIRYIIIRAFNHIGFGQSENFFIPSLVNKILNARDGDSISVGNLNLKRDFSDVRDMVYAYRLAMDLENGIYNICSEKSVLLFDIVDFILKLSNKKLTLNEDSSLIRKDEPYEFYGSCSLFKSLTGYKNRYTLEETLKWIYQSYVENTRSG